MSSANSNEQQPSCDLPPEVFLDTSIHIARLKGGELRQRVDDTLRRFRWKGTASYAKLEYGNVILSSAGYLLDKLEELGSLEKLRYHITNQLIPKFALHRKYQMWFFNLLHKCFNKPEATERAKRSLRHLLRMGTDMVSMLCDETRDNIGCVWADQEGQQRWKRPSRCQSKRPGCYIDTFFQKNQSLFCEIGDTIRSLDAGKITPQLASFADIVDRAINDPKALRNAKLCRGLADAIIAVESHGYHSFFTQNISESQVLCPVVRQLLLYLHQDPGQPVSLHDFRSNTVESNSPCPPSCE